jgi:hypothetical protein
MLAAIRETVDELTEHAAVLTSIPFPLSEWQSGDGPDDERWRALTEVERREVLSMVSAYERLIGWAEQDASGSARITDRIEQAGDALPLPPADELPVARLPRSQAIDYLQAERARVCRFRQEMGFLDRRRTG